MRKEPVLLLVLLLLVLVLVLVRVLVVPVLALLVQDLWEEAPLAEASSREDVPEGTPGRKRPGRVAVTRTTAPRGNNQ
jgi:hypothetical protein